MARKILLGAPSLIGKDASDSNKDMFADATYPLKVVITNHMPRDIVLPEVKELFLKSVYDPKGSVATVVIQSADQLKRIISSVEQICELNQYQKALTIEELASEQTLEDKAQENTIPEIPANPRNGDSGKKAKTHHKRG